LNTLVLGGRLPKEKRGKPGRGRRKKKKRVPFLNRSTHHTASTIASITVALWLLVSLLAVLILYNSSSCSASRE